MEQGSSEWLELRKSKITATDAAVIMGESEYDNAYDLWRRKLGLLPPVAETAAMREGRGLESEALECFNKISCLLMKPKVVFHPQNTWMMASLDGMSYNNLVAVEIKCGAKQFDMITKGDIPKYIWWQLQHQLACTGHAFTYLFCYRNEGSWSKTHVDRDDNAIKKMIIAEADFYRRLVEFDPPAPKHRKIDTEEMELAVDTYRIAKDMLARAEENEKEARGKLMALAGGECIEGYGLKVTHYAQRGAVDYGSIPALQGIDLDIYRKPPTIRSRITL